MAESQNVLRLNTFIHTMIVVVCGTALAWFVYIYAGGPQTWDDLLYLEMALNPDHEAALVHRYFHILLLRWAVLAAGDTLEGARVYWGAMYAATVMAVYIGARLLAYRKATLIGVVGVCLFVGLSDLIQLAGVPYADFTVMMLVAVVTVLYISWCRIRRDTLLGAATAGLIGVLSALAVFSKETAIILLVPLIPLIGYYWVKAANSARFRSLAAGFAAVIAAVALVWYFVMFGRQDPLLSLWGLFDGVEFNIARMRMLISKLGDNELMWDSYYTFSLQAYPVLFVAYLVSILRWNNAGVMDSERVSWYLPIALLFFLTAVSTVTDWGIQPRYAFPMLPVLAIWGAQMFQQPEVDGEWKDGTPPAGTGAGISNGRFVVAALIGMAILSALLVNPVWDFIERSKWSRDQIYEAIVLPVSALSILSIVLAKRKWTKGTLLALIVATIGLLGPRVDTQIWLLRSGTVATETKDRFQWLDALKAVVDVKSDSTVFISNNLYKQYAIGGRSDGSSARMINIYFNIDIPESSVEQSENLTKLDTHAYDIVLLTKKEWKDLQQSEMARRYSRRELTEEVAEMAVLARK